MMGRRFYMGMERRDNNLAGNESSEMVDDDDDFEL